MNRKELKKWLIDLSAPVDPRIFMRLLTVFAKGSCEINDIVLDLLVDDSDGTQVLCAVRNAAAVDFTTINLLGQERLNAALEAPPHVSMRYVALGAMLDEILEGMA